jgi:hypothetical protein
MVAHHSTRMSTALNAILIHAAELLESEAAIIRECHTVDGEWFSEEDEPARVAYQDMMETARDLRELARANTDTAACS